MGTPCPLPSPFMGSRFRQRLPKQAKHGKKPRQLETEN